jgi:hypothetical protein
MSELSAEVALAIEDLIEALDALRSQLQLNENVLGDVLGLITGGASVAETLRRFPAVEDRQSIDDAVRSVYEARQRIRHVMIPAAIAEGVDMCDIARAFGVTLDTVAGHAHDTR